MGPLLWHFENSPTLSDRGEGSIELSLDEVKDLARKVGFELSVSRTILTLPCPTGLKNREVCSADR